MRERAGKADAKKKEFAHVIKRIYRPEVSHCLECGSRLWRAMTLSEKAIITLTQVVRVVHCGYRCPQVECPGRQRVYRSSEADALALPGFTFGLDIILLIGQLRLKEHRTVDEIHEIVMQKLKRVKQTISRREMLFLFEAYTAVLRAGTEANQDEAWKEEVRNNGGLLLAIDGIQPDRGNDTIYLVRDVLTGRMLHAENVTDSTRERLKQLLQPVLTLQLPVVGVISDAQPTELQAVAELWPEVPHQICQFHALKEAGRLIFVLDQRTKTEMRVRIQQKAHEFRQNIHKRVREAEEHKQEKEQEIQQWLVLEEYAAQVEGAINSDAKAPFQYGGLDMQEALMAIEASLACLEQGGIV